MGESQLTQPCRYCGGRAEEGEWCDPCDGGGRELTPLGEEVERLVVRLLHKPEILSDLRVRLGLDRPAPTPEPVPFGMPESLVGIDLDTE